MTERYDSMTSVPTGFVTKILGGMVSKEEILKSIEKDSDLVREMKENKEPSARVKFYRLDETSPDAAKFQLEIGYKLVERVNMLSNVTLAQKKIIVPADYNLIGVKNIYNLSEQGRSDVLRIGRFADCDFIPEAGERNIDPVLAMHGLNLDVFVSREHALIALKDNNMVYIDYGTFKEGSRNGTCINNNPKLKFRNQAIVWNQEDSLHFGNCFPTTDGSRACRFKIEYEPIAKK